ncbi:hypothetical protein, partial [Burkholderia sp. RS02]|uniref:hypothetical protein n=1 Tax=unclassified Burkholderia TaxID=2613784 RepID=UPI003218ABFB
SSIPRIGSSAQDHEHDISNAPPFEPVYTVPNFNSLLGLRQLLDDTLSQDGGRFVHGVCDDRCEPVATQSGDSLTARYCLFRQCRWLSLLD